MPLTSRNKPQQPTTGARYSSTVSVISATPNSSGHAADHRVFHSHDEWSDAKWSFILWCLLSATLAGLVDGASLSGVYREATSHLSGVSTKMALRLQDPPLALTTALASNLGYSLSFWDYLIIVCSFGLGSLICGFVLVDCGVQGSPEPLLLNVNLGSALNFQHRVVIAMSALSLLLSSLIVYCMEHHICFFGSCHSPHAIFAQMFLSMTFASCACGLLNGLTSCSKTMIFRASHMTGTITDAFLLVGYYMRTGLFPRSHAVRFGVLIMSWICFVLGGFLGAAFMFSLFFNRKTSPSSFRSILLALLAWHFVSNVVLDSFCQPASAALVEDRSPLLGLSPHENHSIGQPA